MSQRFAKELRRELPEVDAFIGLDQVTQLGDVVEKILNKRPTPTSTLNANKVGRWMLSVRRWALTPRISILRSPTIGPPTFPITTRRVSDLLRRIPLT